MDDRIKRAERWGFKFRFRGLPYNDKKVLGIGSIYTYLAGPIPSKPTYYFVICDLICFFLNDHKIYDDKKIASAKCS